MNKNQEQKRGVGAPFRGRKFVQMRLLDSFTPDEIDYLREYVDAIAPNLIALRRAKFEHEKLFFETAQNAQKVMNSTMKNPDKLQVLVNMTGTDTDKFTNDQQAQICALSNAGMSEFIYMPNSRKSASTRAKYVMEKMREFEKKHRLNHSHVNWIEPVIAYPLDAASTSAYTSLQQEINAQAGSDICKAIAL